MHNYYLLLSWGFNLDLIKCRHYSAPRFAISTFLFNRHLTILRYQQQHHKQMYSQQWPFNCTFARAIIESQWVQVAKRSLVNLEFACLSVIYAIRKLQLTIAAIKKLTRICSAIRFMLLLLVSKLCFHISLYFLNFFLWFYWLLCASRWYLGNWQLPQW